MSQIPGATPVRHDNHPRHQTAIPRLVTQRLQTSLPWTPRPSKFTRSTPRLGPTKLRPVPLTPPPRPAVGNARWRSARDTAAAGGGAQAAGAASPSSMAPPSVPPPAMLGAGRAEAEGRILLLASEQTRAKSRVLARRRLFHNLSRCCSDHPPGPRACLMPATVERPSMAERDKITREVATSLLATHPRHLTPSSRVAQSCSGSPSSARNQTESDHVWAAGGNSTEP